MEDSKVPEQIWKVMQAHLGYDDEQLARFKAEPRNARVMAAATTMSQHTIVFEVVQSHGCNSQHQVGTRFFFSGDGNLLSSMNPKKICAFALPNMTQTIFAIQELWYQGLDPNQLTFKRSGCFDVGIQCGGWGHIVYEARVVPRQEAAALAGRTT